MPMNDNIINLENAAYNTQNLVQNDYAFIDCTDYCTMILMTEMVEEGNSSMICILRIQAMT